jgi:hypothetical protein
MFGQCHPDLDRGFDLVRDEIFVVAIRNSHLVQRIGAQAHEEQRHQRQDRHDPSQHGGVPGQSHDRGLMIGGS